MQTYPSLPSQPEPMITGTGFGGLLGIAVLFFILIVPAFVHYPAASTRARPSPTYRPMYPTQATFPHFGLSHYQAKTLPGLDRIP